MITDPTYPRIRLRTHEDGSLILSGPNGEPGPPAINVTISATPGSTIAAVEYLDPQLDVIADVATLARLEAAETAARRATALMFAVMEERPPFSALCALHFALNDWRRHAKQDPLKEIEQTEWQELARKFDYQLP